ncbi:MAG TPA: hypothetical protein VL595_27880 [Pseudonocardia sp.]|nr:hypothetical protein [Pseudonocardia sp.]
MADRVARTPLTRVPEFVGVVTTGVGIALLVAPRPLAVASGVGDRPTFARVVGAMDLALVPGLMRGRPRWPWMLARAAANLPIAAAYRTEINRTGGTPLARKAMLAMLGLSVVDTATAIALRKADRAAAQAV